MNRKKKNSGSFTNMLDGQFDWDSLHLNNNGGDPKAVKILA